MQGYFAGSSLTVVLERPDNISDRRIIGKALNLLEPYITALSTDNAIKALNEIEAHPLSVAEIAHSAQCCALPVNPKKPTL